MNFEFTEEQRQFGETVARYLADHYGFEDRKRIVRSDGVASRAVWQQLADLGVLAIPFSEVAGGFGGGTVDMINAMQSFGAALVVEPVLATLVGGRAIDLAGTPAQREAWLAPVTRGQAKLALACTEKATRYHLERVATTAVRTDRGWRLDGRKCAILGAPSADALVVLARTAGQPGDHAGLALFYVPCTAAGVTMTPSRTFDNQRAADVRFSGVELDLQAMLGSPAETLSCVEAAQDFGIALLCSEAVGAMQYALDATVEYLKTRRQFGQPIGSFQALQHRAAQMFIVVELTRSMSYLACSKVDGAPDPVERAHVVSAAKIMVADAARLLSQDSVQLHGGMGLTEELKISHTFRRLTMIAQELGDADFHLQRFARLDTRLEPVN